MSNEHKKLIEKCDSLFQQSAKAWEYGNNSGDSNTLRFYESVCVARRRDAEDILRPFGIRCDYPGLYPSFHVNGFTYYTTESAVSAALEQKGACV